ncbi:hypothetical protein PG984_000461 [Apiospora sp. TS-2023a]
MAHNYGEPYNSKMKTETTLCDDAAVGIMGVKDEMVSVIYAIVGEIPIFNEPLALVNYPNMSMGWYKDGENDVGSVVTSQHKAEPKDDYVATGSLSKGMATIGEFFD